jgi:hypothetical protein
MAETGERLLFTFQEVAEALIKKRGLHTGIWGISLEFGLGAANFNSKEGSKEVFPSAVVPVRSIGLRPATEENSLTVDASKVNPKGKAAKPKRASKDKRKST